MSVSVKSGTDDYESSSSKSSVAVINIETVRMQLAAVTARLQSRVSIETLRPVPMFLGVSPVGSFVTTGAFTFPIKQIDKSSPEKIKSRVKLNLNFFLSNYALIAAMVGLVVALMHPGMLLFLAGVYALWSLHGYLIRHELLFFGINIGSLLTIQQRFYVLFVITSIVVIVKCLGPAILFLVISTLLILSHAFLRDPKHIESSSLMNEESSDEDMHDDEEGGGGDSSGSEVLVDRPGSRGDAV